MFFSFYRRRNSLDTFPRLASSFEVDRLLKRTFLHAIPVWELHKIIDSKKFHVFDVCVALVLFFSRHPVPDKKVRNVSTGRRECDASAASRVLEKMED